MKKAIVLGCKGNLGSQLVKVFKKDHEVIGWDRENIDITDSQALKEKIRQEKPYAVINAVAYNAVDKCEESEEEYQKALKLNKDAVRNLADICNELDCVLVHYSTDYVFSGDENNQEFKEDSTPNPLNNYGKSKYLGEKEILKTEGLKYYLIRTSKLFGPKGQSELVKPSFFDIMIKLSKEKDKLEVVNEEKSFFTYTVDLAKKTRELLENDKKYGIYHITNSDAVTWYEAALEMFKILDNDIQIDAVSGDKFPRPAKRPLYSILINTKIEPLRSYSEALKEYLCEE